MSVPTTRIARRILFAAASLTGVAGSASAATLYWDGDQSSQANGDGASAGGTGTWDTSNYDWDNGSGASRVIWNNAGNDTAVLGGTAGTITFGSDITTGAITLNTSGYILNSNAKTVTINGVVSGAQTLTYGGSGTFNLNGINTNSGNLTIDTATVNVASTASLFGSGFGWTYRTVTLQNGGKLVATNFGNGAGSLWGQIGDGTSNITYGTGGGTFEMTGATMDSTVNKGFDVSSNVTGTFKVASGTTTWSGENTSRDFNVQTGGTLIFNLDGNFSTSRELRGAGGFTKTGAGTLTLSGVNSFTGTFTVSGGKVEATASTSSGSANATGDNNTITVNSGATLRYSGARGTGYHAGAVNVNGGTITFDAADMSFAVGNTVTFDTAAGTINGIGQWRRRVLNNKIAVNAAASGSIISVADLNLYDSTPAFDIDDGANPADLTISSKITGGAGLNKTNRAGTLVLSSTAAGSNVGAITIGAGTLEITGQIGSGTTGTYTSDISNAGTLKVNSASDQALSGAISGAGALVKSGGGILTLNGTNTFSGKTTITGGVLKVDTEARLGANPAGVVADQLKLDGGTLALTASFSTSANRGITLGSSGGTIDTSALATNVIPQVAGIIAGTGSLTLKANGDTSDSGGGVEGYLRLSGVNTFTGGITISSGLVKYDADSAFGNSANVITLSGGGIIDPTSGTALAHAIAVASGSTGYFRLFGSTNSTWSGAITGAADSTIRRIDGGTLTLTGNLSGFAGTYRNLNSSWTVLANASAQDIGGNWVIAGTGSLVVDSAANQTLAGVISSTANGAFVKRGSGKLTLTNTNTYTVTTTVNAGTLEVSSDGNLGTAPVSASAGQLTLNGGTLLASTGFTLAANRGVSLGASGGTIQVAASQTLAYGGIAAGAGSLTKSGNGILTLSGANTFSGGIAVQAGTLAVTGASGTVASQALTLGNGSDSGVLVLGDASNVKSLTFSSLKTSGSGSSNAIVAGGNSNASTLTINSASPTVDTFAGVIGGVGTNQNLIALTKTGTGTLKLSGANTFTKALQVNGGVLEMTGGSWVGSDTGNQGALQMGVSSGNTGEFKISGGTLNLGSAAVNGVTGTSAGNGMRVGNAGNGTFTQTGGTVQVGTGGIWIADGDGSTGTMTLSGGALTSTGGSNVIATRGTGTLTISDLADVTMGGLQLGHEASASSTSTLNLNGGTLAVTSLTKANGTGRVYFNGGTLKARSNNASFLTNSFNSAEVKSGGVVFDTNSYNVTVAQALIENATSTGGGLTKNSAGTLTLSSAGNAYTGATTVNAGTLDLTGTFSGGTYGGAISVGSSGTFKFSSSTDHAFSGALSGSGAFQKAGSGLLTLSGGGTYSGAASVSAGILEVTGNLSSASSTLALASGTTLRGAGTVAGTVNAAAGAVLTAGDGTTGSLTLGALTFAGNATLNIGVLSNYTGNAALAVSGALSNSGTVTLNLGATSLDDGVYRLISFGSGITGTSGFTVGTTPIRGSRQTLVGLGYVAPVVGSTPGYLTYTITGAVPFWVGSVTVGGVTSDNPYWKDADSTVKNWSAGGVSTDYFNASATPSGVADAVIFSDAATGTRDVILNDTVTPAAVTFTNTTAKAYTLTGSGAIAGNATTLLISGSGSVTIGTANTFGGGTTLANGTLVIANNSALGASTGTVTLTGGTLNLNGRTIANAIAYAGSVLDGTGELSGSVDLGGVTRSVNVATGATATLSGVVSNGGLTKAGNGTLVLSGTNSFSGGTTVSNGVLRIGAGGTSGSVVGNITNNATVEFSRAVNAGTTYAYSGVISGTGAVKVLSGSALKLTGANTYSGATTVESGATLTIGNGAGSGSVASASSIVANGALVYDGGASGTSLVGAITGSGSVTANSARSVQLSGDITLTGAGSSITLGHLGGGSYLYGIELVRYSTVASPLVTTLTAGSITINGDIGKDGNAIGAGGTVLTGTEYGSSLALDTSAYNGTIDLNVSLGRSGVFYKPNGLVANAGTGAINVTGTGKSSSGWRGTDVTLSGGTVTIGVNVSSDAAVTVNSSGANSTVGGVLSGTMSLTKQGNGKLTLSAANTYSGTTTVSAGTLEVSGSGVLPGAVTVANGATLSFAAGTKSLGSFGLQGNLSISGSGNVSATDLFFASATNGQTLAVSAGALTVSGSFKAGNNDGSGSTVGKDFTLNQAGGTITISSTANNEFSLANWGGTSTVNLSAGTLSSSTYYDATVGQRGTGNLTVSGTATATFASTSGNGLVLGGQSSGTGNLYLDGGTLTVLKVVKGSGTGNVFFDGGTLRASADTSNFLAVSSAKIRDGGAAIDTNGRNVTIAQSLVEDASSTGGGLTKTGTGTLALSAANSHTGGTTVSAGTLAINNAGALGSGALTLAGGNLDNTSGGAVTVSSNNAQNWNGDFTFTGTNNLNLGTGAVTLGGNRLVTVSAGNLTVGGVISGSYGLTKAGAGTLTLSAANSHGGDTTVSAGTLAVGNNDALGAGGLTVAGGTLRSTNTTARNLSNAVTFGGNATLGDATQSGALNLSGTVDLGGSVRTLSVASAVSISNVVSNGGLTKDGAGTLALSGANAHTGGTTVSAGTLAINSAGALGSGALTLSGGNLDNTSGAAVTVSSVTAQNWNSNFTFAGTNDLNLGAGTVTLGGNRQVTVSAGQLTVGGVISDGGNAYSLTKLGVGDLILNGINTYSGGTYISAGKIIMGNAGALGTVGDITVAAGATLDLAGFALNRTVNVSSLGTLTGLASYSGTINANGNLALNDTNASFAGQVVVSGGNSLTIGASNALGSAGSANIASGASINLGGNSLGTASITLAGNGGGAGAGAMVNNSGTATHGGTLTLADSATIGGDGDITLTGTITDGNEAYTLTKAGAGTLTIAEGASAAIGSAAVTGGKFVVDGSLDGALDVAAGGTLGGHGTISGETTISGAHSPGNSPGIQTFGSNLTYQGGATINWELGGNTQTQGSPVVFDQIIVNGVLTLNAGVNLVLNFEGNVTGVDSVNWADDFWGSNHKWKIFDLVGPGASLDFGGSSIAEVLQFGISYDPENPEKYANDVGTREVQGDNLITYGNNYLDSSLTRLQDALVNGQLARMDAGFYLTSDGTGVFLNYRAIPEPSTYGLILGGLALAAAAVRRRKISK